MSANEKIVFLVVVAIALAIIVYIRDRMRRKASFPLPEERYNPHAFKIVAAKDFAAMTNDEKMERIRYLDNVLTLKTEGKWNYIDDCPK